MLKADHHQLAVWDAILPAELRTLPEELARVDEALSDPTFIEPFRDVFHRTMGRPSTAVATFLRLMYLKYRYDLGYEVLVKEVSDSLHWRRFCHLGWTDPVPDPSTLMKLVKRIGPEVLADLNRRLVQKARSRKLIRGQKMRVDTTVVEANVHYPTDSGLIRDGVRVVTRTAKRLQALGVATRTKLQDRSRAIKKRAYAINKVLRRRSREKVAEVRSITDEMGELAGRTLGEARRVLHSGRRLAKRAAGRLRGREKPLLKELEAYVERLERSLEQARKVSAGDTHLPDRLVSVFDPDARPIQKGKAGKPTEFGYKAQIEETDGGFITGYQVYKGNPADSTLLDEAIDDHERNSGRQLKRLATDRGYWDEAKERKLRDRGVVVAIPKRGYKSNDRKRFESTTTFKRLQRWRAGGEARISLLKRKYGLRRTRLRELNGATSSVGLGVWAHNLDWIARAS